MTQTNDKDQTIEVLATTSKSSMTTNSRGLERTNRMLDDLTQQNLKPATVLERLFPTKLQRESANGVSAMIRQMLSARVDAQKLIADAHLKNLKGELDQGLATAAIHRKEQSMVYLTTRKLAAEQQLNESLKHQIAEYEKREQEAMKIKDPELRKCRLEMLRNQALRYMELVSIQNEALAQIITDYCLS